MHAQVLSPEITKGTCISCAHRYFQQQRDGTVLMNQSGVFRTNCMDCLDRTNVVQGLLAREALQEQLTVSSLCLSVVVGLMLGVGGACHAAIWHWY